MESQMMAWIGFHVFMLAMLALDLGVFHRKSHEVKFKEAIIWSAVWIVLALIFNAGVWKLRGSEVGLQFLTGYLIEKSLSVDNIFVFLIIFSYFAVPAAYQHKLLFWGVLGALAMRGILIAVGVALIARFHWIIYVFGTLLILTAVKMLWQHGKKMDLEKNPVLRLFRKVVPSTREYHGDKFWIKQGGKWLATPMLAVLVIVELSDLVFAVDSIPAILAISSDPFIVYTSNAFAILGLRSLYFALAGFAHKFHLLHYGLAAILAFVGTKMLLVDVYKIPVGISLAVIAALLTISTVGSVLFPAKVESVSVSESDSPKPVES